MMFKSLFVPINDSKSSERAMTASIALAKQLGAAITGFVVEPDVPLPNVHQQMSEYERAADKFMEKSDTHARKLLSAFEQRAAEAGVPFTGRHAHTGAVDAAIVEQAESSGCDMIVMVTHGRGTFNELLFGSHTKNVLSHTKLPLLVLK